MSPSGGGPHADGWPAQSPPAAAVSEFQSRDPSGAVKDYASLIHRLTYRRTNHENMHVRGYKEEGTTTTPFDMTVLNDLDRFHLAGDVIDRVTRIRNEAGHVKQFLRDKLTEHKRYIVQYGNDMPEIRDWKWTYQND